MIELNNPLKLSDKSKSVFLDTVNKKHGVNFIEITIRTNDSFQFDAGMEALEISFNLKDKYNRILCFKAKYSIMADILNPIPLDEKIMQSFRDMLSDERGFRHYRNMNRIDIWKNVLS